MDDTVHLELHFTIQHLVKQGTQASVHFADFSAFNTIVSELLHVEFEPLYLQINFLRVRKKWQAGNIHLLPFSCVFHKNHTPSGHGDKLCHLQSNMVEAEAQKR